MTDTDVRPTPGLSLPRRGLAAVEIAADRLEFELHQRKVAADPVVWVKESLGETLWSKQREVMLSVRDHRRTAVQSAHDTGKSFLASRLACWWISAHPPGEAFVVSTAPTFDQVRAILWREINKAHTKGKLIGRMNETEWKIDKELVAFGRKPSDYSPSAFQGIHARYVFVIVDEACGIPEMLWNAADTLITNEDARILAIGNPDDPTSEFAKLCAPGTDWHTIRINAFDSPNFTGEEVPDEVRSLLISKTWVEEKQKKWGELHPFWQSKVLGLFPQQSDRALLPLNLLMQATRNEINETDPDVLTLGVDVARFGTDRTVIALRQGGKGRIIFTNNGGDTMETAGQVKHFIKAHSIQVAGIDVVGVGGGVYDKLASENEPVYEMNAAMRARDYDTYGNARAEWYWTFREMLERGEIDLDPNDEDLLSELAAIQFKIDIRGRIVVETKEDMKKRGMPSPDLADALIIAFGVPSDQDWNAAYGVMICLGCTRGFLIENRQACPFCGKKIDE